MKKDYKTIWKVPKNLSCVQPELADEMVRDAENKMGYPLPKEYIELLKVQNGGCIRYGLADTPHRQIYGIGPNWPTITDFKDLTDHLDDEADAKEVAALQGLFPFDGDGHWHICLDYRKTQTEPEITFLDIEYEEEHLIANHFAEYLDLLEPDIKDTYFFDTTATFEEAVKQVTASLKTDFDAPGSMDGYPISRGKFKDSWVWMSPNTIPAGSARENDQRYEELKAGKEPTSLRYPEISATSMFIDCEKEVRDEVFTLLAGNSITICAVKDLIGK